MELRLLISIKIILINLINIRIIRNMLIIPNNGRILVDICIERRITMMINRNISINFIVRVIVMLNIRRKVLGIIVILRWNILIWISIFYCSIITIKYTRLVDLVKLIILGHPSMNKRIIMAIIIMIIKLIFITLHVHNVRRKITIMMSYRIGYMIIVLMGMI